MTRQLTPQQATRLLHEYVPLLATTGAQVIELAADRVALRAPLERNQNLHGTAFGGSLSMLGIVCGWLLALHGQQRDNPTRNIVVADSLTRFVAPVRGDLEAHAGWEAGAARRYRESLAQGRRAEVDITVHFGPAEAPAATQHNRYVAEA